uniref:Transposase n=1 Tax=Strongyloides venezuelensis TaxID=75913 RepID=A0A0K0FQX7_STRVS
MKNHNPVIERAFRIFRAIYEKLPIKSKDVKENLNRVAHIMNTVEHKYLQCSPNTLRSERIDLVTLSILSLMKDKKFITLGINYIQGLRKARYFTKAMVLQKFNWMESMTRDNATELQMLK